MMIGSEGCERLRRTKRSQRGTLEEWKRLGFMEKSHKIRLTQGIEGDEEQIKMLLHLISQ